MSRSSLRDAAAIASTICQIAKGVVLSPNGANPAAASASCSTGRPWPTQAVNNKTTSTAAEDFVGTSQSQAALQDVAQPAASRPWPSKMVKAEAVPTEEVVASLVVDATAPAVGATEEVPETSSIAVPFVLPPPPPPMSRLVAADTKGKPVEARASTPHTVPEKPTPPTSSPIESSKPSEPVTKVTQDTPEVVSVDSTPTSTPAAPAPALEPLPSDPAPTPAAATDNTSTPSLNNETTSSAPQTHEPPILPADFEEYDPVTAAKSSTTPLRAAKVPSSRLGRLFHYGGLASGLAFGAASSLVRNPSSSTPNSLFMSESNVARLVDKLSTMRGAALKLGQFLSIQETKLLPPQIEQVLLRVQNSANYMPVWQMNSVMTAELGPNWRDCFSEFQEIPFASASIGQVHAAVLKEDFNNNGDKSMAGKRVAVKVQFPGLLESIDSDLGYLKWLVGASALLPKGLFLENTLRVLGRELKDECDYTREAEMGRRFGTILQNSTEFEVPKVVDTLSTGKVLTTEMMRGRPLSQAAARYDQTTRNRIAKNILNLSLSELFRFRLMQTDPNWSNFLYNERTGKIQLIDFGATREYSKEFMDNWMQMLQSAISSDYTSCLGWSRKVGYLTGDESEAMERAHVDSMIALGEPFRRDAPCPYPFEKQTITDRVKEQIPLMLRERLTPPPEETYSLNRKLSGAFLLCARLRAEVDCRGLWEDGEREYKLGPVEEDAVLNGQGNGPFSSPEQRRTFHTAFSNLREQQQERKHGRNLMDRFPRSQTTPTSLIDTASTSPKDTVESLSSNPTGSPSLQETPVDSTNPNPQPPIDLTRSATPAEITPTPTSTPASMGPTIIRGITIPLRPPPPGPEECCMSGCAHCAYDIYAEDLEDFHERLSSVRSELSQLSPAITREEWREDLLGTYPSSDADEGGNGGEDLKTQAQKEVDKVIGNLDPTMRAFLEMERKLKQSQRDNAESA